MKGLAAVVEAVLAGRGIDGHAADGIARDLPQASAVMIVAGYGMTAERWPPQQAACRAAAPFRSRVIVSLRLLKPIPCRGI